jgi:hypothetical protein
MVDGALYSLAKINLITKSVLNLFGGIAAPGENSFRLV